MADAWGGAYGLAYGLSYGGADTRRAVTSTARLQKPVDFVPATEGEPDWPFAVMVVTEE